MLDVPPDVPSRSVVGTRMTGDLATSGKLAVLFSPYRNSVRFHRISLSPEDFGVKDLIMIRVGGWDDNAGVWVLSGDRTLTLFYCRHWAVAGKDSEVSGIEGIPADINLDIDGEYYIDRNIDDNDIETHIRKDRDRWRFGISKDSDRGTDADSLSDKERT